MRDTEAERKEGRNVSIDVLKGVAAFLVVLGHFVAGKEEYHRLFNFIYSFHMPLFMFLAGYTAVVSYRHSTGTGNYLAKRFVNIMVPYLFWIVAAELVMEGSFGRVDWRRIAADTLIGNKVYWFLPTLYGLIIGYVCYCGIRGGIYKLSGWQTAQEGIRTLIDAVSCVCVVGIFAALMFLTKLQVCRDIVGFTIPFFAAVMYVEHKWVHELLHHRVTAVAAILVFLLLIGKFDFNRAGLVTSLLRMILGMCAVMILLQFCERVHMPKWAVGTLAFWGRNSLMIYLLPNWILGYARWLDIPHFGAIGMQVWYGVVAVWVCIVRSLLSEGLSRIPIVKMLAVGKTRGILKLNVTKGGGR